jgi:predicted polyphosphate/ATP-dependent NAD kinase
MTADLTADRALPAAGRSAQPVGLIANPASGKDIRRLVAHASVFGNDEKVNIVRRALLGLAAAGVSRVLVMPDRYRLCERAADGAGVDLCIEICATPSAHDEEDTMAAARAMAAAGVACIITLGGDGTNRAAARGTCAVPFVAVSTGTNNVFPTMIEGTAAGLAAGTLAAGWVAAVETAPRAKLLRLRGDGVDDLALIDVAVLAPGFPGARAIWEMERVRRVLLTRASPAAMGLAALGGVLRPVEPEEAHGLDITMDEGGRRVRAPIAPGMIAAVRVSAVTLLQPDTPLRLRGPCLLALDGERSLSLPDGAELTVTLRWDGPPVVDVDRCLRLAATRGFFGDAQDEAEAARAQSSSRTPDRRERCRPMW